MIVRLESIEKLNYNVVSFHFSSLKPLDYTAGQFIEMYLPDKTVDNRGPKRWFTLSSSPTEKLISITTKFTVDQGSDFKNHLHSLKIGDSVEISEAMGDFVLPKDKSIPLIFVAGGIGVTPYHSMVRWLTDVGEKRDIKMLVAANTESDILFKDLFTDYAKSFVEVISFPSESWQGETGRLSGQKIIDLVGPIKNHLIYLSGPEQMVEALETNLVANGVKKDQLVGDFFPGYPADLA